MENQKAIIIGGGLSGLAAGIRLSQYGVTVHLFEKHSMLGGLNSYYGRNGRIYDTGLHAMTNVGSETDRSLPLNVLFRQLRIRRSDAEICPQTGSEICFPDACLPFDNDFSTIESAVGKNFPEEYSHFQAFVQRIRQWNPFVADGGFISTQAVMAETFSSARLRQMLLMPVMFYGNSLPHDMDFRQFSILFRSMFFEGMGRPRLGMKHFIALLKDRFLENGGVVTSSNGIEDIHAVDGKIESVLDAHGTRHQADVYLSCAGAPETASLIHGEQEKITWNTPAGKIGYAEFIFELNCLPQTLGMTKCVVFQHENGDFDYAPSSKTLELDNMVICVPGNFAGIDSREVRVTVIAAAEAWQTMHEDDYREEKELSAAKLLEKLDAKYPGFSSRVIDWQMYTPRTFTRFTSRINGSIYGSPDKAWNGRTPYGNLHLIGTDQGYLGIVGALMSGVTIANGILRTKP